MAMTPEGRIKAMVKKLIDEFNAEFEARELVSGEPAGSLKGYLYAHWPVQNGMGSPTLDCNMVYYGRAISVETKAPGKHPTPRQVLTIRQMEDAGALVFVIDGQEGVDALRNALNLIKWAHADDSKQQAQVGRGPAG